MLQAILRVLVGMIPTQDAQDAAGIMESLGAAGARGSNEAWVDSESSILACKYGGVLKWRYP